MKNPNPHFCIKNFRAFGEDGANFELAPITVLTGCNSAGKSSLVKALMLLSNKRVKMTIDGIDLSQKLTISSKEFTLGGYKSVVHGEKNITMSYKVWSPDLQEMLVVKREFRAKYNDALNDGVLYHLTVEKLDGTLVYEAGPGWGEGGFLHYNQFSDSIKTEFNRFYAVGCYMKVLEYQSLWKKIMSFSRKKIEKGPDNDIDISRAISSESALNSALNIAQERLQTAGTTESEAVLLWDEFSHETFTKVIRFSTFDKIIKMDQTVSLPDLIKDYNEADENLKRMMDTFLENVVNVACSPFFMQRISYINSTSAQIARLYSAEDDNKMCNALRIWNDRNIDYQNEKETCCSTIVVYKPGSFLNKWIKKFGIGESLELRGADEGLGLMVYLNKGGEKRLLADEGYGMTQLISLLLQIDNSIPLIVGDPELVGSKDIKKDIFRYPPRIICVEEPEVHLHPKYQSLLAEMFAEAFQMYNIHFVIETHSEYLIRKLQVMVTDKENALTPNDVSLNYVEKDENGISTNRKVEILEDGRLSESFGSGFYDESDLLAMELFRKKAILS